MRKTLSISVTIMLLICLSGCSWTEHFTIGNLSDESIFVSYKVKDLEEGMYFGIFTAQPKFYRVYKKGGINWNEEIHLTDMDTTEQSVSVALPAKTVMVFGTLNNDHYESTEQYFINGRDFNLDFIEVEVNLEVHHISKATFDDHFNKKNGYIKFDIH